MRTGVEVMAEGLTTSFGRSTSWSVVLINLVVTTSSMPAKGG